MTSIDRPLRAPTQNELAEASAAVRKYLKPTPLIESAQPGVWLKLETFQPTGSFKVRGAIATLGSIPLDTKVITASAGNHGLGMAYAAHVMDRRITVVVPENASPAKVDGLRRFPVELVMHGQSCDEAEDHAVSIASSGGALYVSPYNDARVVAGQATIGDEIDELNPSAVVCGVGGGGLCAGIATWSHTSRTKVFGVESAVSRAVSTAIDNGGVISVPVGDTVADGLAGQIEPSTFTWEVIQKAAVTMLAVDDRAIGNAMRWLFDNHGLISEGAGSVALAAVLTGIVDAPPRTVVVISGRNISRTKYLEMIGD